MSNNDDMEEIEIPSPGKKEKNLDSEKYQPITDRAKAEAIGWAYRPESDQDKNVFSNIGSGGPYVFSSVISIYNYIKQLLEAEIRPYCKIHKDFHSEKDFEDKCKFTGQLSFKLNQELKDLEMKGFVERLLELSPAVKGRRAEIIIDMIKNMNRPSMNPMAMISGLMGGNTESPDDLIEEVPGIEKPES